MLTAAIGAAVHLLALAPALGDGSPILDRGFGPQAEAILAGALPYSGIGFEYPPGALLPIVLPALMSTGEAGYRLAFEAQMLLVDLAIVALLAFSPRRGREAVAVYTAGVLALTGIGPLPDSAIDEAPLTLARFDLLPAALVLGAILARETGRNAAAVAALSAGTAVKAFPAIAAPAIARGLRANRRLAIALAAPLLAAAVWVLASGDNFGAAIEFHSDRALQVESVAATPFELAHLAGAGSVEVVTGSGSFNLEGGGTGAARWLSLGVLAALLAGIIATARGRAVPPAALATALLAAAVTAAPVLSPQFLLWVLPVSALAFGLSRLNLLLVAAAVATQVMLAHYAGVSELEAAFVWSAAARNALLVAFLIAVLARLRDYPEGRWRRPQSSS